MKIKFYGLLLLLLALLPGLAQAQDFVNLTPKPKKMTVGKGELVLPESFGISAEGLTTEMKAEVQKFAEAFNAASGYHATVSDNAADALLTVSAATTEAVGEEGYKLDVTSSGASIQAATPAGLFFAFQTVKKILPANVMAGVRDAKVTKYALPAVSITDEPRFGYRGFMLDVARHFFTVEDVKRMLDVMSYYKMNRFHWHLSDDQGWRVEIKKYPKLTEVGSIAPNSRFTDMQLGQYWINRPYGPYFYTQEELKDVVAYAKERHIEIIPEIDMPGHFVAAMASYPEYSCNPEGSHIIWSDGGISSDVLNVANPAAVQFAKDILSEIMEIFPYDYIHIGGDECPTSAWQNNAECQARYRELGLTSYRQLQSHFIKDVGGFIKEKGRKVIVWNEAISEEGADTKLIQDLDALVFCWTVGTAAAGAKKAAELGLNNVYTPWGPYYINRKQDPNDPPGAGDGSDNVQKTYNEVPVPSGISAALAKHYTGVQGTFWTEHVSDRTYMEYLALPRLIAVAEAGWTPQAGKNFTDFQKRMTADSVLLNYNNYNYCRHFYLNNTTPEKVYPKTSTATEKHYYRMVTRATADATRAGSCIELLHEGSPLIGTWSGKGAAANTLWTNAVADDENADWQLWALEEDAANPGHYALVCKALPEGSVNPVPTASSTAGRWKYDAGKKNYDFILGDNGYGQADGAYHYSIRSEKTTNVWMNAALSGQGYAVNAYGNPADGNGGIWSFRPLESEGPSEPAFDYLTEGKTYVFDNAVEEFKGISISDNGTSGYLTHSNADWSDNVWVVTKSTVNADNTQSVQLKNLQTGRYIGTPAANASGTAAFPVAIGTTPADIVIAVNPEQGDFTLSIGGKNLFPLPYTSSTLPGVISSGSNISGSNAVRPMGAAWTITEVRPVAYVCKSESGEELGTFRRGLPADASAEDFVPAIENHSVVSSLQKDENTIEVTYRRSAYSVTTVCKDGYGALISVGKTTCPVGGNFTVSLPEHQYYTLESSDYENGSSFTPEADITVTAVYSSEAYNGVKSLGQAVSTLEDDHSYVIYDNSPDNNGGRKGFRNVIPTSLTVNRSTKIEDANPYHTWTLEASGKGFKVKNSYLGSYVPLLSNSQPATLKATGGVFTFTRNADGESWQIKGSNNTCWDGLENGNLVGWNAPGHPYIIYEYFVQPYFEVLTEAVDTKGNILGTDKALVKAGSSYTLTTGLYEGYKLKEIQGDEDLTAVGRNMKVTIVYESEQTGIGQAGTETGSRASSIYDLSGRRVSHVSKSGIYIVNGHKVLVR